MHRRDFNLGILKIVCGRAARARACSCAPIVLIRRCTDDVPIAALYKNAIVIDSLCAPLTDMDAPLPPRRSQQCGNRASPPSTSPSPTRPSKARSAIIAAVESLVEQHPEAFLIVRQHSDIARAKRENKIGIMPGFQYTAFLEEKPDRIEMFRQLGVRIMQLTYNNRSIFGDGCLEPGNAGLSKAGIAAVKKMNDLE